MQQPFLFLIKKWTDTYEAKIHNPLNLGIKSTFDLVEKLKPSIYFEFSKLEKLKNTEGFNTNDIIEIKAIVCPFDECRSWDSNELFKFKFDFLTDVNNYRKTNSRIKRALKKYWNYIFNTNSIGVNIYYDICHNSKEMSRLEKEYKERMRERKEQLRREQQAEERRSKREEKLKRINEEKTFKSDECVICLSNPPNVLFCNCGHLCLCIKCNKTKGLRKCPICKAENTIKRTIEN